MKDIEQQIDRLAGRLPKGYQVQVCVENGSGWLQVLTPDLRRVPIEGDHESCWAMLMADALTFCLADEDQNREAPEEAECNHEWEWHATGAGLGHYCHKCDAYRGFKG